MKLTRTSLIILIVGVIIVAAVGLGMTSSNQAGQQQQLEQQLAQAKKRLALIKIDELAAQKDQLSAQIASFTSQEQAAKQQLSSTEESISASETVLETAAENGVEVVSIASSGQSSQKLVQTECEVIPMDIEVQGDFTTIANFVLALSRKFPTGVAKVVKEDANPPAPSVIPAVSSNSSAPGPSPLPVIKTYRPVSATINLVIYNYGGN